MKMGSLLYNIVFVIRPSANFKIFNGQWQKSLKKQRKAFKLKILAGINIVMAIIALCSEYLLGHINMYCNIT